MNVVHFGPDFMVLTSRQEDAGFGRPRAILDQRSIAG